MRGTSSGEEGEVDAQSCPCGKTMESSARAKCDLHKEERGVLEGVVWEGNKGGMN